MLWLCAVLCSFKCRLCDQWQCKSFTLSSLMPWLGAVLCSFKCHLCDQWRCKSFTLSSLILWLGAVLCSFKCRLCDQWQCKSFTSSSLHDALATLPGIMVPVVINVITHGASHLSSPAPWLLCRLLFLASIVTAVIVRNAVHPSSLMPCLGHTNSTARIYIDCLLIVSLLLLFKKAEVRKIKDITFTEIAHSFLKPTTKEWGQIR